MNKKSKQVELSAPQLSKLAALIVSFNIVADRHIHVKVGKGKGDANSIRTREATRQVMGTVFRRLFELGFQIEDFRNMQQRHVQKLVLDWHASGLQPKTINNYLSIIRKCGGWVGKSSLVPAHNAMMYFLPDEDKTSLRVSTVASVSKSWSEQGIDVIAKIKEADAICTTFGAMLRLGLAFGLRRKEQIRCVPSHIDGGDKVLLRGSVTKSGRDRDIEIVDSFQRECLDHAKQIASRGRPLGWPRKTYAQSVNHYNYLMNKKLGITGADSDCVGHGLRAEFSENMAVRLGFMPPTLGGSVDQMPREAIRQIQAQVTKAMGHNRPEVVGAYYGSVRSKPKVIGRKICSFVIGDGLIASLHMNPTPTKNESGEFVALTMIQRERCAVHVQIECDGVSLPIGTWRIRGCDAKSLNVIDGLEAAQLQLLGEKLQLVMGKMGWKQDGSP